MLRRRAKPTTSEHYNWIDLKCPSCDSYDCLKVEDKRECSNPSCKQNPTSCNLKICDHSIEYVSGLGTIQQKFICMACGYKFCEIRRVL